MVLPVLDRAMVVLRPVNRRQRQVNQVVVFVNPDMQDGLQFHLVRPGVVG